MIGGSEFTKTEVEVMRLLSLGKKAQTIADAVGISKSTVDKMVSNSDDSRSLLPRIRVGSREELITWYVLQTQPERIVEMPVYQDLPWYRSDTTMRVGLIGFYIALVCVFFFYWGDPNARNVHYIASTMYIGLVVGILVFGQARWWHPFKTEGIDYISRPLVTKFFMYAVELFMIGQYFWVSYFFGKQGMVSWVATHIFYIGSFIGFIAGFWRLYSVYDSIGLHTPHYSRRKAVRTVLVLTVIGSVALIFARGWGLLQDVDPLLLIFQLILTLGAAIGIGQAIRQLSYATRIRQFPLSNDLRQLMRAVVWFVAGFLLFVVATIGFSVVAAMSAAHGLGIQRAGWVEFVYATAILITGLGVLRVPLSVEQQLIQYEEGDEDIPGGNVAVA